MGDKEWKKNSQKKNLVLYCTHFKNQNSEKIKSIFQNARFLEELIKRRRMYHVSHKGYKDGLNNINNNQAKTA